MRHFKKRKILMCGLVTVGLVVFVWVVVRDPLNSGDSALRGALLKNKLVQSLIPTYHALRKLPDLLFFPYLFSRTSLPVYQLTVQPVEALRLSEHLPADPISGQLTNEERVYVKAGFQSGSYSQEVKVRYRGTSAQHWNSFQKSLRIKFPKTALFEGKDNLNLIIPYDRFYYVEPLNFYRARKLGLTTLDMQFVRVIWNGEDMGVYLSTDGWSDGLIEQRPLPVALVVYGADDARSPSMGANADKGTGTVLSPPGRDPIYLSRYTTADAPGALEALTELIYSADDDAFKRLIPNLLDLKKFYAWNVVNILAGSEHYDDTFGNIFLIFNPVSGMFEISPWDPGIREVKTARGTYEDTRMRLMRRILSIPEFRAGRDRVLKGYLDDPKNLEDDLSFYDTLYRKTKRDFLSDNAKLYNDIQYLLQVKTFRNLVIQNFRDANIVLSFDQAHYLRPEDAGKTRLSDLSFGSSFARLQDTTASTDAFIARYPAFKKVGEHEVLLPSGAHTFLSDVILPSGVALTIEPGTTLYFGEGASLMVFGRVRAEGSVQNPIRFLRAYPGKPWGVFAVVNAPAESSFRYVEADGGSGETILGRTFTGMVAFYHSPVRIGYSRFTNAGDDDGLNVKEALFSVEHSVFQHTYHDAIDADIAPQGSLVAENTFRDIGYGSPAEERHAGDCVDISWSRIRIRGNRMDGCTDKGVSVGESSHPVIEGNTIEHASIGIAVKDSSEAIVTNTSIRHSEVGIDAYQKHAVFGGGIALVSGVRMEDVTEKYKKDALSAIEIR